MSPKEKSAKGSKEPVRPAPAQPQAEKTLTPRGKQTPVAKPTKA